MSCAGAARVTRTPIIEADAAGFRRPGSCDGADGTAADFAKRPRAGWVAVDAGRVSLDHLVRRQGGVLALRQAVALGMSAATVQRRAREGSWQRLYPAVYLLAGHRLTDEARVRAAWLWAARGRWCPVRPRPTGTAC